MLTLIPPGVAVTFYVLGYSWVNIVQRGKASQEAVTQLKTIALAMLISGYIVGFGEFVFVHYVQRQ